MRLNRLRIWMLAMALLVVAMLGPVRGGEEPVAPESPPPVEPPPPPPVVDHAPLNITPPRPQASIAYAMAHPAFQAAPLPLESSNKEFNVNFVPYARFHLNFMQNLTGQDRSQTDVTMGNFDPDSGVVTETEPRGKLDAQFGVERMVLGVQMSFDERWYGGVELEAASTPVIGGANASGGSAVNLSLAYLQVDFGAGFFNHSLAFGRIPTLYVSYFDETLWQHRFIAPGFLERNKLEYRTDDGVRLDGFNNSQSWLWSIGVCNGAAVGNESQFDGGKSLSAMVIGQPFGSDGESLLGGLKLLALVNMLDRASTGGNPRLSSAKRHLLLGAYYTAERFRCGLEVIPWGTRGREARRPTARDDGNVFGLSVWAVFAPQPSWDVLVRLDVWDPNTSANDHNGVFIATPTLTKTAPGQEQIYVLLGASKRFNAFVQGSLNLEIIDDSGKLQFAAAGAQKATGSRVDLSVRFGVSM